MPFKSWASWTPITTGSGTVTLSGDDNIATCVDGGASDRAYLRRYLEVSPGDVVQFEVMGFVTSGAPSIVFDHTTAGSGVVAEEIAVGDLRSNSATYIVPETSAESDYLTIAAGVFLSDAGECVLFNPTVFINGVDIDAAGGIVESGSGANGTYTMWADGRMEQEKIVEVTDCATAWGSVYASGLTDIGSFEKTFVGDWDFTATANGSASGGLSAWAYSNNTQVGVCRGSSATGTFYIHVHAIGRWK